MNDLQKDKEIIESRSILRDIDEEDYYDMLVAIRAQNDPYFNPESKFFPLYRS